MSAGGVMGVPINQIFFELKIVGGVPINPFRHKSEKRCTNAESREPDKDVTIFCTGDRRRLTEF